jgi:predicted DNA-binding protein
MPTAKPRLTITLNPKTHAVLKALSDRQDRSMASLINEVLDDFVPAFQHVLDAVQALERAEGDKRAQITAQLDAAAKDLHPLMEMILTRADRAIAEAVELSEPSSSEDDDTPNQETNPDADDARHPAERSQAGAETRR